MKNILIVEPDYKTSEILKKTLSGDELRVFVAESAQTAIDIADKQMPDLIILELAIPDQNGIAFLHELRSYPDWAKIPVLVHTHLNLDDQNNDKAWQLLDIADYLYKPTTSLKKFKTSALEILET